MGAYKHLISCIMSDFRFLTSQYFCFSFIISLIVVFPQPRILSNCLGVNFVKASILHTTHQNKPLLVYIHNLQKGMWVGSACKIHDSHPHHNFHILSLHTYRPFDFDGPVILGYNVPQTIYTLCKYSCSFPFLKKFTVNDSCDFSLFYPR